MEGRREAETGRQVGRGGGERERERERERGRERERERENYFNRELLVRKKEYFVV